MDVARVLRRIPKPRTNEVLGSCDRDAAVKEGDDAPSLSDSLPGNVRRCHDFSCNHYEDFVHKDAVWESGSSRERPKYDSITALAC
jgi:hypothetical protein